MRGETDEAQELTDDQVIAITLTPCGVRPAMADPPRPADRAITLTPCGVRQNLTTAMKEASERAITLTPCGVRRRFL